MKEILKNRWREILLVVLLAFGLNKCTTSCNRANDVETLKTELLKKDSVMKIKDKMIDSLVAENKIKENNINNLSGEMSKKDNLLNDMAKKQTNVNVYSKNR